MALVPQRWAGERSDAALARLRRLVGDYERIRELVHRLPLLAWAGQLLARLLSALGERA